MKQNVVKWRKLWFFLRSSIISYDINFTVHYLIDNTIALILGKSRAIIEENASSLLKVVRVKVTKI